MMVTDAASAFQAIVAHYEATGWDVRTINHVELRATVRASVAQVGDNALETMTPTVATASACRKLWVDAKGEVQETDVPC